MLGAVLAACGSTAGTTAPASIAATPAASVAVSSPSAPASEAACRTVTHALGETCIPANPQRVVTLGCQTSLEYVLALGLPLVGYDVQPWAPDVPPYIDAAQLEGATTVGSCFEPDLEAVEPLNPDLIVYTFDAGTYPQVSAIAPTIVLQAGYVSYRDDFLGAAELLGRTEQAEAYLADLDTRIAALKDKLAPVLGGKTVSMFRTGTDGQAQIASAGTYQGELLADLGLERPEAQQTTEDLRISLEQIGLLDGDVAFAVFGYTDPSTIEAGEATKAQYTENALWQTLTFVKNDAIYQMDQAILFGYHGIYWADAALADIEDKVLGN
jgi:iron complex transport system substrate-binding protein